VDGQYVELADLLSANLRVVEQGPQTFLDGKLMVSSSKRRQMVLCTAHPYRWPDLPKYKLLIIQTARHFSGSGWLEYDLAFRTDGAASGLSDWSRMNLDLYNFHLRSPALVPPSYLVRLLPRHQLHFLPPPVTPAWSLLFAIHRRTDSVVSPLVGANIDTAAVTVKVNTHRSTVHFPTPVSPIRGQRGTLLNGRLCRRGLCTWCK